MFQRRNLHQEAKEDEANYMLYTKTSRNLNENEKERKLNIAINNCKRTIKNFESKVKILIEDLRKIRGDFFFLIYFVYFKF